jgi:asparagine synthase (glutamine-hydrolysing)
MSGFGGIIALGRNCVDHHLIIELMDQSLQHYGKDGKFTYFSGQAGFIYRPFHTTEESHWERQPFVFGNLVVTLDGRIDNRSELFELLSISPTNDVQLFTECYRTWGNECFSKIVGDFAAAIWDSDSGEVTLVRDPFGIRKVFYVQEDARIIWSTDISALLNCPGVSDAVDEHFVAMSLAYLPDGQVSPFESIRPVRPGHFTILGATKCTSRQYWGISSFLEKTEGDRSFLVEKLRFLLSESIGACLRSDRTVTAELSGGLDSSTIVCVADVLSRNSLQRTQRFCTLSHVYDHARQSDEREYISLVEQQVGRAGIHIKEDDDPILSRWPDPLFTSYPNRVHCFGGLVDKVQEAMNSMNSRVILSGDFGDHLFVSHHALPYSAVDAVREGRCIQALNSCRQWSLMKRQPLLQTLWHAAIRPNLPFWMRQLYVHNESRPCISPFNLRMPLWLDPSFAKRTNLKDRVHQIIDLDAKLNAGSSGIRFATVMQAVGWFGSGYDHYRTTTGCVEVRYPYLYRPLFEFLISVPFSEHCTDQTARSLHRAAMQDILPERIRTRTTKSSPFAAISLAIEREWRVLHSLIENSRACNLGFVVREELFREANRLRHGLVGGGDIFKFIAVEMWLRALEARRIGRAVV